MSLHDCSSRLVYFKVLVFRALNVLFFYKMAKNSNVIITTYYKLHLARVTYSFTFT